MIKEIAFTGYPTKNIKNARAFYEGLLGLVPTDEFGAVTDESQFIEYTIGTGTFALGCMESWNPSKDGPSIAFEVDDIDATIAKLKENNVEFFMEKMDSPVCFMAIVRDPDGNMVTIHHRKNA